MLHPKNSSPNLYYQMGENTAYFTSQINLNITISPPKQTHSSLLSPSHHTKLSPPSSSHPIPFSPATLPRLPSPPPQLQLPYPTLQRCPIHSTRPPPFPLRTNPISQIPKKVRKRYNNKDSSLLQVIYLGPLSTKNPRRESRSLMYTLLVSMQLTVYTLPMSIIYPAPSSSFNLFPFLLLPSFYPPFYLTPSPASIQRFLPLKNSSISSMY